VRAIKAIALERGEHSDVHPELRKPAVDAAERGKVTRRLRAAMLRFAQGVDTLARVFGTLWYYR